MRKKLTNSDIIKLIESKAIREHMKKSKDHSCYSYEIRFKSKKNNGDNHYSDENMYDSYTACLNAAKTQSKKYARATKDFIVIISKYIYDDELCVKNIYVAVFNEKYEYIDHAIYDGEYEYLRSVFWIDNIHLMYKIPFKDGDLVINKANSSDGVMVVYESKNYGYDFLISNGKRTNYFSSGYKLWPYLDYYDGKPKMSDAEIKRLRTKTRRLVNKFEADDI